MLYVAFICSLFITIVASATAIQDFGTKPNKRPGIVITLIIFTIPFIYLANEVLEQVF